MLWAASLAGTDVTLVNERYRPREETKAVQTTKQSEASLQNLMWVGVLLLRA